ncbi:hypothetical protein ECP030230812_5361, partial [Escherichia coli P0302308.12]
MARNVGCDAGASYQTYKPPRRMYAATLISPFECQCFALDQTHHQRQQ